MSKSTISTFELMEMFPDGTTARKYIENRRWKDGVVCPAFSNSTAITCRKGARLGYYRCRECSLEFTVRTGTIFERSPIPLNKWIFAIYLVVTARKGISSLQLAKEIGITQKSAWFMLHRIREACQGDNDLLSGVVEMDETYIGGKEKNKHKDKKTKGTQGRSTKTKTAVVAIRSRSGKVKATSMKSVNGESIQQMLDNSVAKNSTLCTDEATVYQSVWAVLKRGFVGTFHHFSKKHIDRYINEFTFRLNEGNVKIHTVDRINSVLSSAIGSRLSYKMLVS
ncbi:MAG: IS1595 family transposase [Ostreibacterium sp.]